MTEAGAAPPATNISYARNVKLSDEQVREIFRRVHTGEQGRQLAREFGVDATAVSNIKNRRSWTGLGCRKAANAIAEAAQDQRLQPRGQRGVCARPMRLRRSVANPQRQSGRLRTCWRTSPSALALLKGADAIRERREAGERVRVAESLESWERVSQARAIREAQLGKRSRRAR